MNGIAKMARSNINVQHLTAEVFRLSVLFVIIESRDTSQTIEECLACLERQKDKNIAEIIVVDCSTDGTTDIIKKRFPDVILIESKNKSSSWLLR